MRHKNQGRKFDRNTSSRRAMFRNLAANLILHERIETTDAKAKELRRVAEKLITKARRLGEVSYTPFEKLSEKDKAKRLGEVAYTANDKLSEKDRARRLATERQLASFLTRFGTRVEKGGESKQVDLVEKVLVELSKRFATRPGGYTRIVKFGPRRGDNAPMAMIELLPASGDEGGEKKTKKKAKKETAAAAG